MTPDEKELVDLMNANTETVDELMYRLRYAPPEALDAIYNGVLHALRLSGKATRVFSIQGGEDKNAFSWAYRGKGRHFYKRRPKIRNMEPAARGRAVFALADDMRHAAERGHVHFKPCRVDWFTIALCIVYGKRPTEAVAAATGDIFQHN